MLGGFGWTSFALAVVAMAQFNSVVAQQSSSPTTNASSATTEMVMQDIFLDDSDATDSARAMALATLSISILSGNLPNAVYTSRTSILMSQCLEPVAGSQWLLQLPLSLPIGGNLRTRYYLGSTAYNLAVMVVLAAVFSLVVVLLATARNEPARSVASGLRYPSLLALPYLFMMAPNVYSAAIAVTEPASSSSDEDDDVSLRQGVAGAALVGWLCVIPLLAVALLVRFKAVYMERVEEIDRQTGEVIASSRRVAAESEPSMVEQHSGVGGGTGPAGSGSLAGSPNANIRHPTHALHGSALLARSFALSKSFAIPAGTDGAAAAAAEQAAIRSDTDTGTQVTANLPPLDNVSFAASGRKKHQTGASHGQKAAMEQMRRRRSSTAMRGVLRPLPAGAGRPAPQPTSSGEGSFASGAPAGGSAVPPRSLPASQRVSTFMAQLYATFGYQNEDGGDTDGIKDDPQQLLTMAHHVTEVSEGVLQSLFSTAKAVGSDRLVLLYAVSGLWVWNDDAEPVPEEELVRQAVAGGRTVDEVRAEATKRRSNAQGYVSRIGIFFSSCRSGPARFWGVLELALLGGIAFITGLHSSTDSAENCRYSAGIALGLLGVHTVALAVVRPYISSLDNGFAIGLTFVQMTSAGLNMLALKAKDSNAAYAARVILGLLVFATALRALIDGYLAVLQRLHESGEPWSAITTLTDLHVDWHVRGARDLLLAQSAEELMVENRSKRAERERMRPRLDDTPAVHAEGPRPTEMLQRKPVVDEGELDLRLDTLSFVAHDDDTAAPADRIASRWRHVGNTRVRASRAVPPSLLPFAMNPLPKLPVAASKQRYKRWRTAARDAQRNLEQAAALHGRPPPAVLAAAPAADAWRDADDSDDNSQAGPNDAGGGGGGGGDGGANETGVAPHLGESEEDEAEQVAEQRGPKGLQLLNRQGQLRPGADPVVAALLQRADREEDHRRRRALFHSKGWDNLQSPWENEGGVATDEPGEGLKEEEEERNRSVHQEEPKAGVAETHVAVDDLAGLSDVSTTDEGHHDDDDRHATSKEHREASNLAIVPTSSSGPPPRTVVDVFDL